MESINLEFYHIIQVILIEKSVFCVPQTTGSYWKLKNNYFMKKLIILSFLFSCSLFAKAQVIISEIDYDNVGTDNNEKIELFAPNGTDLTGWSLILYDGASGAPYNTTNLSGSITGNCTSSGGQLFGVKVISYTGPNAIQNGAPDGMALVNASGVVVEFLSYEGTFTAVSGPANGMLSTDIAPDFSDLNGTEGDFERHFNNTWAFIPSNTFGTCNAELLLNTYCSLTQAQLDKLLVNFSPSTFCIGSQVTLSLPFNGSTENATFQWIYNNASTNGQFANLGTLQNSPAITTVVAEPTFYYCVIFCNGIQQGLTPSKFAPIYGGSPNVSTVFTVDCNTYTTQLSLSGLSAGLSAGISYTYQWQNNENGVDWNNITGATSSTLSAPNSETIAYRCNITACGGAANTISTEVVPAHGNCYCLPIYTFDNPFCIEKNDIYSVSLNTLMSITPPNCNFQSYTNIPPVGLNTTNLNRGWVYNLQLFFNLSPQIFGGGASLGAWIDYNDNYQFEASERITDLKNLFLNYENINIPVSVPANAPLGMHRMRIRENNNTQNMAVPACGTISDDYFAGETKDYTINIVAAPACLGGDSVGGSVSANQTICNGNTPAALILNGQTGTVLFWQQSTDAAFTYPKNIINTSLTLNIGAIYEPTYFRAVIQNNNCLPAYSTSVLISITNILPNTMLATDGQTSGGIVNVSPIYYLENCNLIASSNPISNIRLGVNITAHIDASVQNYSGTPYLQRHFTVGSYTTPVLGFSVTLYVLQSEFTAFNAAKGTFKPMPISGNNSDPNIANIKIHQFSNAAGIGASITNIPNLVFWNDLHNWWEITVTSQTGGPTGNGLSEFYIETCQLGGTPFTWVGNNGNSWQEPSNWNSNTIPCACSDVIIPNNTFNTPFITGTNNICHKITVNTGANVNFDTGAKLVVNGN